MRISQPDRFSDHKNPWSELSTYIKRIAAHRILLLTSRSGFIKSGAADAMRQLLQGYDVTILNDYIENPQADAVVIAIQQLKKQHEFDLIIALGGGSVIDYAKLIKAYWSSDQPVYGHLRNDEPLKPSAIPIVAIPTTAGSGSESTHFAVVYDGHEKYSVAHQELLPDQYFLVPSLLKSLPKHVAAASGCDALCQAIESYWSIHSTEASRPLAKKAMVLAWQALYPAVINKDPDALKKMSIAANLAGQAINITKTTAPHAVSYAMTSHFGISHGHAVGVLLPKFLNYNHGVTDADNLDPRGVNWVKQRLEDIAHLLDCNSVEKLSQAILEKLAAVGLETDIKKLGVISEKDRHQIIQHGFNPQRVNNNPRKLTQKALEAMLTT